MAIELTQSGHYRCPCIARWTLRSRSCANFLAIKTQLNHVTYNMVKDCSVLLCIVEVYNNENQSGLIASATQSPENPFWCFFIERHYLISISVLYLGI